MPLRKKTNRRLGSAGASTPQPTTPDIPAEFLQKEKPKKKRLTKAEKALAKLEKQCDTLRVSGQAFSDLVDRMDRWLRDNHSRSTKLFAKVDVDGEGFVTFDEFKAGMYDLLVPCTTVELHLVCQLLDRDETEEINYKLLEQGLKHIREREQSYSEADIRPALKPTPKPQHHCPKCKLAVWDGEPYKQDYPRFIEILFRLVEFSGWEAHPGNFNQVTHSHVTGHSLIQIIRDHTSVLSPKIGLFRDKSCDPDVILPLDKSLEECGFKGGTVDHPEELVLYYDYNVDASDCPLLSCDHYFGQKLKLG